MIRLEPFGSNDFEQLINWISDEDLLKNWSGALFSYPLNRDSLEWYIEDTNIPGSSDAFVYKAVDGDSGMVVGHISIGGISWKNRSGRISRVFVGNESRNKGICSEMVMAALKTGFEELQLHRISLGVYDDNPAALKCYQNSGMKIEGISRDILFSKGKWFSMIEMSMLEYEWNNMTGHYQ